MNAVKAKVVNGRFVIDEPTDLPEGTELYLVPVSEEDEDRLDIEAANRPVKKAPLRDRALAAADRLMDVHEETYRKLAE